MSVLNIRCLDYTDVTNSHVRAARRGTLMIAQDIIQRLAAGSMLLNIIKVDLVKAKNDQNQHAWYLQWRLCYDTRRLFVYYVITIK